MLQYVLVLQTFAINSDSRTVPMISKHKTDSEINFMDIVKEHHQLAIKKILVGARTPLLFCILYHIEMSECHTM